MGSFLSGLCFTVSPSLIIYSIKKCQRLTGSSESAIRRYSIITSFIVILPFKKKDIFKTDQGPADFLGYFVKQFFFFFLQGLHYLHISSFMCYWTKINSIWCLLLNIANIVIAMLLLYTRLKTETISTFACITFLGPMQHPSWHHWHYETSLYNFV